jgi:hypothetical protein
VTVTTRTRLLVGILPVVAVLTGAYLLAWSWAWPHHDMRNVWALIGGVLVAAMGIIAAAVALLAKGRAGWSGSVAASIAAVALGLFVLVAVSARQAEACGDELAACRSLLPGF